MAKSGISKSLPKRAASTRLKERRHASWLRGQERKRLRQAENEKRHRANVASRKRGELTPWELAKQRAREKKKAETKK